MSLKQLLLLITCFTFTLSTYAQESEQVKKEENLKFDIGLDGMLGFSMGNDFYSFNVGGPSLMLHLSKNWKVGAGALPSFYIKEGSTGARLGVSPKIEYKNFVLIAPFLHFESANQWVWSIGLGYKFHLSK